MKTVLAIAGALRRPRRFQAQEPVIPPQSPIEITSCSPPGLRPTSRALCFADGMSKQLGGAEGSSSTVRGGARSATIRRLRRQTDTRSSGIPTRSPRLSLGNCCLSTTTEFEAVARVLVESPVLAVKATRNGRRSVSSSPTRNRVQGHHRRNSGIGSHTHRYPCVALIPGGSRRCESRRPARRLTVGHSRRGRQDPRAQPVLESLVSPTVARGSRLAHRTAALLYDQREPMRCACAADARVSDGDCLGTRFRVGDELPASSISSRPSPRAPATSTRTAPRLELV